MEFVGGSQGEILIYLLIMYDAPWQQNVTLVCVCSAPEGASCNASVILA
jgi:hypothetical protein